MGCCESSEVATHHSAGGPSRNREVEVKEKGPTSNPLNGNHNQPPPPSNSKKNVKQSTSIEKVQKLEQMFKTKRENVFTKGIDLDERSTFTAKRVAKTQVQEDLIRKALNDNFIFSSLSEIDIKMIVDSMDIAQVKSREFIIRQGEEGDFFYIVYSGELSILVDGKHVGTIGVGAGFGELALLHNTPRAASIKAETNVSLFSLDRKTFRYIIAQSECYRTDDILTSLKRVKVLQQLTDDQFQRISDVVQLVKYQAGDAIFRKGTEGNIFYMISTGSVKVTNVGENFSDTILKEGDYFGERALLTGEPRSADTIALTNCTLLTVYRTDFTNLLGNLQSLIAANMNARVITSIHLFDNLTSEEKIKLAKSFQFEKFESNTTVITQGDRGDKFYILFSGELQIIVDDKIQTKILQPGDYFGEMALLDDEVRKATIKALKDCECYSIDRTTFARMLGSLQNILTRHASEYSKSTFVATKIKFSDLNIKTILGSGTFGRVYLVTDKTDGNVYALKTMFKSEVVAQKQTVNVLNEKNVMIACNHPFVLRLFQTFKDAKKLYMLLEFVQGGELFCVLHSERGDGVSDRAAQFYGIGVILAIAHLHYKDIAHRDLKPENVLVDKDGYPKLVDFGFAKVIKGKSFTLCGTPEYLAPELVLGRGHNKSVDYWAFGVLIFEMLAGYSPFHDPHGMDQVVICRNIVNGKVGFTSKFNNESKDICRKLLSREVANRLGNFRDGVDDIVNHEWLSLDKEAYKNKAIKAPWIPNIKSKTDTSSFDPIADDGHNDNSNYVDTGDRWDAEF